MLAQTPMDATVADYALPAATGHDEAPGQHQKEQGEQLVLHTLADEHVLRLPSQRRTSMSTQSRWMVIIGCVLALFVIGAILTYTHVLVPNTATLQTNNSIVQHATAKAAKTPATQNAHPTQPSSQSSTTQLPAPASSVAAAAAYGTMTYGTTLPGNCDQNGNYWSVMSKTQLSCTSNGMDINSSSNGTLNGALLKSLPAGKTMPDNYLIQVQTTVDPSQNFGVFFRAQDNSLQNGYALVFNPGTQNVDFDYYQNSTPKTITSISAQSLLTGAVTIDIAVQSNNYFAVFINGTQIGDPYSTYGYSGGKIGLIAQPGTTVTFKNLELYPLQ
jgi:hypothetical protein